MWEPAQGLLALPLCGFDMKRFIRRFAFLAVTVLVAACGDSPLADFGVTDEWLSEGQTDSTRTATAEVVEDSVDVTALTWYTPLAGDVPSDSESVTTALWERSSKTDAFVQAAANELSVAVPELKVPASLPQGTSDVTSQLVFGVSTGRLTNVYVAAFGFWKAEPYVGSRSVSQVLQLFVAPDQSDPSPAVDDPTQGCGRFVDANVSSCEAVAVSGVLAWWVVGLDGANLIWFDNGLRYEMLDRQQLGQEVLIDVANSMVLLRDVAFVEQSDS